MWKNLKGYFIIEEEENKGPKKSSIPDRRNSEPTNNKPSQPAAPPSSAPPQGKVSDRFVEILLQSMERANQPGFDYLEYKKALKNLEKMNFDDSTKFQTAYAAAQSMGVTPDQLVKSAEYYLKTLKGEEDKFSAALAKQRNDQIAKKENRLTQLGQSIQEQEARIKELQDKIAKTRAQQEKLRKDIANSTGKIAKTQADFERTYRTIVDSIKADVAKMKEYLGR